jgi:hypothetical protein
VAHRDDRERYSAAKHDFVTGILHGRIRQVSRTAPDPPVAAAGRPPLPTMSPSEGELACMP